MFSLIYEDGPIGRAYLRYFKLKKYFPIKIYYLYKKINFIPEKLNLKIYFYNKNYYPLKFIKEKKIINFCKQIEEFFQFENNFIKEMYENDLLDFFKDNIIYIPDTDINSNILFNQISRSSDNYFINTSKQIYKKILDTNKSFYHIHPGYLPLVRGADGTLNSLLHHNCFGASFYKMTAKIDDGDIFLRESFNFKKFNLVGFDNYKIKDIYRIWFSFFDPILRCSLLKKILQPSFEFNKISYDNEMSFYYSFLKDDDLKTVFKKIFS
jgi:hypothetical protein